MNQRLHIKLFGFPQIALHGKELTGFDSDKVRALLIYLAMTAAPQSRDHLAQLLWEDTPLTKRDNLRKAVSNLGKLLGDLLVKDSNGLLAIKQNYCWVDVHRFDGLYKSAMVDEAVALYSAEFLSSFAIDGCELFEQWVIGERTRLKLQMLDLLHLRAAQYEKEPNLVAAIHTLRRLLELDPYHEEVHRWLMAVLAKNGQRTAALAQFDRCEQAIREALDVPLSQATFDLYFQIKNGEFKAEAQPQPSRPDTRPSHLPSHLSPNLSIGQLEATILEALRLWHTTDAKGTPLQALWLFRSFQQQAGGSLRHASNQFLRQELERLQTVKPELSTVLHLRFADDLSAQQVAARQNVSDSTIWRWQQEGIRLIAESLQPREETYRVERHQQTRLRLPAPTYSQLVAVEKHLDVLSSQLTSPNPPWLLAIEGMGGMGKTALADALVRRLIDHEDWADVVWVTAQQRSMSLGGGIKAVQKPALTVEAMVEAIFAQLWHGQNPAGMSYDGRLNALETRLKGAPHLLVIDNLETHLDVESLLTTLRRFVAPSKVLLTTRQRLLSEADIFHFALPELSEADTLRLLRHEATMRNLPALLAASDRDLHPIYASVGGNPLALRLVVGQLHVHPLAALLADLKAACGQPITNLYSYIYRQAWESLSECERKALFLMLLTAEQGEPFSVLTTFAAGQLEAEALRDALDHLLALSLVDARGGLHERRYTIHSLTRSFLHRQVLRWEEG